MRLVGRIFVIRLVHEDGRFRRCVSASCAESPPARSRSRPDRRGRIIRVAQDRRDPMPDRSRTRDLLEDRRCSFASRRIRAPPAGPASRRSPAQVPKVGSGADHSPYFAVEYTSAARRRISDEPAPTMMLAFGSAHGLAPGAFAELRLLSEEIPARTGAGARREMPLIGVQHVMRPGPNGFSLLLRMRSVVAIWRST